MLFFLVLRKWRLSLAFAPATIYYYLYFQQRWVASTFYEFFSYSIYLACVLVLLGQRPGWRVFQLRVGRSTFGKLALACAVFALSASYLNTVFTEITVLSTDRHGTNYMWNSWEIFKRIPGHQLFLFEADHSPPPHLFAENLKLENLMIGISRQELGDSAPRGRRDFVHAEATRPELDSREYDTAVFYFDGTVEQYLSEHQSLWASKQKQYPFLDLSSFKPGLIYPIRSGPYEYSGAGVYVTYTRGT
jgi:hypothetical protein